MGPRTYPRKSGRELAWVLGRIASIMPGSLPPAWQVCGPNFPKKYIYIYFFLGGRGFFFSLDWRLEMRVLGGRFVWLGNDRFSGDSAERGVLDGRRQCIIERWIMDNMR